MFFQCRPNALRGSVLLRRRVMAPSLLRQSISTEINLPPKDFRQVPPERPDAALMQSITTKKRLDVAIVGLPNAGKSQLLNVLTESTVSAVSRKRHTTREGILGARTIFPQPGEGIQFVFVDTPGFLKHDPKKPERLERKLVVGATMAMRTVDYTLIVVDAARTLENHDYKATVVELMLQALAADGRMEWPDDGSPPQQHDIEWKSKFGIVLNKVDLIKPKQELIPKAQQLMGMAESCIRYYAADIQQQEELKKQKQSSASPKDDNTSETSDDTSEEPEITVETSHMEQVHMPDLDEHLPNFFYTDARSGEGVADIIGFLGAMATPSQHWPVPAGLATNQSMEERIQEIIREKIYRCLHREVPYAVEQQNRLLKVAKDEKTDAVDIILIHQDLIVYTKSHADLVRGTGNRTLEKMRLTATRDLEIALQCKINLHLNVKRITSKNHERRR